MTKGLSKFDMNCYAEPKSEKDRRTLSMFGYRTLSLKESLEYAEVMKQLTVGDKKIENLPESLKWGFCELRYYKEGASSIGREEGNRIFLYIEREGIILPTALRSEKEVKELPSISELEESK